MESLDLDIVLAVNIVVEAGHLAPVVGRVPVPRCLRVVFELVDELRHITTLSS
jgi:hypothetical protein